MNAVSIQLPDEISQRLQQLSEMTGRSPTDYMIEALREHLDDLEYLYLAEKRVIDNRAGRSKTYTFDEIENWLAPAAEQSPLMTVTGELIRIDFDKKIVTLRYPPTAKELDCSYLLDLENTVIEQRRGLIQVTGQFTLDDAGHPKRLSEVYRIEPVDLSPMTFKVFEWEGRILELHQPLVFTPMLDETQQLFVINDDALAIYVYAQTREQLTRDLTTEMFFLWDEYAQEHPDQLTKQAQQLRHILLQRCQELNHAPRHEKS